MLALTPQPNRSTTPWTEEISSRFRELYETGASHAVIASTLSEAFGQTFTRNACIGRASRMGLQPRSKAVVKVAIKTGLDRAKKAGKMPRVQAPPLHIQLRALREEQKRQEDLQREPMGAGVPITIARGCKYPVADDPDGRHLFCNQPARGSWCAHHREFVYKGGTHATY
jgi:GcrA cell cycle regulator